MKKILKWLKLSNRWKHLIGGVCIGLGADDDYCAAYAGLGVAASLELKDKLWGVVNGIGLTSVLRWQE